MSIWACIRSAWHALVANRLRSFLTMLGIIIGVAAVITMIAIGEGATRRIQEQLRGLGANIILVIPGAYTAGGVRLGAQSLQPLTDSDAKAIATEIPEVSLAAPVSRTGAQVSFGNTNWNTTLNGVTNDYLKIRDWPLESGSLFDESSLHSAPKVAWVGSSVVRELFNGADPIGQVIRVRNVPVTVIGVLQSKGQTGMGQDQDDVIMLPLQTYRKRLQGNVAGKIGMVGSIIVKTVDEKSLTSAQEAITALLRQRLRVQPGATDPFTVRNLTEVLKTQASAVRTMTVLLAAVAGISLVIGGIGIMNIMLVSVTERTREIGLRLAVGARSKDILRQFLIEAISLSLLGGLIGIALGSLATAAMVFWSSWPVYMSFKAVLLSVGFSALVGVFFGFYPARKAALMHPIEALRHE